MNVVWLGHSSVLVEVAGLRLVADPLLRTRIGPLRRAVPLPDAALRLRQGLDRVDAVLVSHLHHDHCDLPSLRMLRATVVVVPPGAGAWLARRGLAGATELAPGEVLRLARDVTVTAVPACHQGRREPRGPTALAVGHVLDTPEGTVWLAGDTALYPEMADVVAGTRHGRLDLAAIPVWGWGPTLGPGHLNPHTAAEAVVLARARQAVPVHWGTLYPAGLRTGMRNTLRTPGPEFARHLADVAADSGVDVRARVLEVGGRLQLDA